MTQPPSSGVQGIDYDHRVNLLSPAVGELLAAQGKVLQAGRRGPWW